MLFQLSLFGIMTSIIIKCLSLFKHKIILYKSVINNNKGVISEKQQENIVFWNAGFSVPWEWITSAGRQAMHHLLLIL